MSVLNVEIKARHENIASVRDYLTRNSADFKGTDHQIDTYFNVKNGRLKLREGNIENSLIFYQRSNQSGPKQSDVVLFENPKNSTIKEILNHAIGAKIIVDKKREIYFIGNVKFHIDEVLNLGSFIEIEAIDKDGNIGKNKLLEQCQFYMKELKIDHQNLLEKSYSDMLEQ